MTTTGALGAFLVARRGRLTPQDVGLPEYGERRRVDGLRREEVAQLAGVGVSYYTRLEQGLSRHASAAVLDGIARALQLDDAERRHLHTLASAPPASPARRRRPPERVSDETQQLLAALGDTPAVLLGSRADVLAWNATGHLLFAGHLPRDAPLDRATRPNMTRLVFLDAHTRELYADWPAKARAVVGSLRLAVGEHSDDPALARLVGDLSIESPEFAGLWADHTVRDCDVAVYAMRHPLVGELTVAQQTLPVPLAPGQRLVLATAPAGSASADALALLSQVATRPGRTTAVSPAAPQRSRSPR